MSKNQYKKIIKIPAIPATKPIWMASIVPMIASHTRKMQNATGALPTSSYYLVIREAQSRLQHHKIFYHLVLVSRQHPSINWVMKKMCSVENLRWATRKCLEQHLIFAKLNFNLFCNCKHRKELLVPWRWYSKSWKGIIMRRNSKDSQFIDKMKSYNTI